MPAPQDISGFYFDAEKNRYFPIRGPIPGRGPKRPPRQPAVAPVEVATSSSSSCYFSHSSLSRERIKSHKECCINVPQRRKRMRATDLLQGRELHGRLITFNESRCNFEREYEKVQFSYPVVSKYQSTDLISDSALQQFRVLIQTPEGQVETKVLSMGSKGGSLSVYEVGKVGRLLSYGFNSSPQRVWPLSMKKKPAFNNLLGSIWSSRKASTRFSSSVSSIIKIGEHSCSSAHHCPSFQNALVTTLGSGALGGSVYFLNFNEPLDFSSNVLGDQRTAKIASFDFTIWTAACNSFGTQAALGTNRGAALIDLETARLSWLYKTKSDVFSQQFDQSGNVILCGLRNGSIIAVDVRQSQSGTLNYSAPSQRGRLTPASNMVNGPLRRRDKKLSIQRCQPRRDSCCQGALMSSAVCSLMSLQSDEQYLLGSSMDGSIKLFDCRLLHRAVQLYEGHVNSHTHLQLGVNPSETLVMSGGEDCYLRVWSIKSGELIFSEKVSESIFKTVCWPQCGDHLNGLESPFSCRQHARESLHDFDENSGAWLGSQDGLFYMHGA